MRTKLTTLFALAAIAVALTGCASTPPAGSEPVKSNRGDNQTSPWKHYVFQQEMGDGRVVDCVWASGGDGAGGPSCNWEKYNGGR